MEHDRVREAKRWDDLKPVYEPVAYIIGRLDQSKNHRGNGTDPSEGEVDEDSHSLRNVLVREQRAGCIAKWNNCNRV